MGVITGNFSEWIALSKICEHKSVRCCGFAMIVFKPNSKLMPFHWYKLIRLWTNMLLASHSSVFQLINTVLCYVPCVVVNNVQRPHEGLTVTFFETEKISTPLVALNIFFGVRYWRWWWWRRRRRRRWRLWCWWWYDNDSAFRVYSPFAAIVSLQCLPANHYGCVCAMCVQNELYELSVGAAAKYNMKFIVWRIYVCACLLLSVRSKIQYIAIVRPNRCDVSNEMEVFFPYQHGQVDGVSSRINPKENTF